MSDKRSSRLAAKHIETPNTTSDKASAAKLASLTVLHTLAQELEESEDNAEPGDAEDSNLEEDSDEDGNDKPEGEEPDADDEEQESEEGDDLPRRIDIPKKRAGKGSGPKNTKSFFMSISYFS
jgi:hypothetical protein